MDVAAVVIGSGAQVRDLLLAHGVVGEDDTAFDTLDAALEHCEEVSIARTSLRSSTLPVHALCEGRWVCLVLCTCSWPLKAAVAVALAVQVLLRDYDELSEEDLRGLSRHPTYYKAVRRSRYNMGRALLGTSRRSPSYSL
jgi:hypothetical protein